MARSYQSIAKETGRDIKTVKFVSREFLGGSHKATPEQINQIISILKEGAKRNESYQNDMGTRTRSRAIQ